MKVKKIAALAIGAAMVGATMGLASAQPTVPNIPKDFFVNADGTPNVKIVVGSTAAAMDVASAADIAVTLGSLLYTEEQTDAQADYVKIKVEYPPETVAKWMIYAYDYQTMTRDHGLDKNNGDLEDWATKWSELDSDYWWNGSYDADGNQVGFVYNYTEWSQSFSVPVHLEQKDTVGKYNEVNWHITLSNIQLQASDWGETAPPKEAKILVDKGDVSVFVDYVLYNYTIEKTVTVRKAMPEWGLDEVTETKEIPYIGDIWEVNDRGGTIQNTLVSGVKENDKFTVFGKEYTVLEIPNNTTFVGGVYKGKYSIQKGSEQEVDGWVITLTDITLPGIGEEGVFVTVKDPYGQYATDEDGNQVINEFVPLGQDVEFTGSDGKKIRIKPTNVFVGMDPENVFADIEVSVNIQTFESGKYKVTYDGKSWVMYLGIAEEDGGYIIKNVTLKNDDKLGPSNPVDIFGAYDLEYKFTSETIKEADVDVDINGDGDKEDTLMVAYAYLCLKEKESKTDTIEFEVGDEYEGGSISGIEAKVMGTVLKPVTEPITVMDYEVNMEDAGANLILIGGPVVNSVTAALADKLGIPSDYNGWKEEYGTGADSGVIKYIENCPTIGGYGVLLVAGTDRDGTKAAAKALMEYLAGL